MIDNYGGRLMDHTHRASTEKATTTATQIMQFANLDAKNRETHTNARQLG